MAVFQYTGADGSRAWYTTYTVLVGVILLAILPFTFLTLGRVHSGRDPARRFVPWLKASFVLFFITLSLLLAQLIITTCLSYNTPLNSATIRAALHLSYLAELFRTLSATTVMVFLFLLGPGIYHAIHGMSSSTERITRYGAYFLAFVVAALAISYYALLIDLQENFSNGMGSFDQFGRGPARIVRVNELMAATAIILWIASLGIMALAVYTWMRRRMSPLKSASTLYLIASFLNLVSSTWNFAYAINWLLNYDTLYYYVLVLTIILGWWTRGLLLILGYFIAVRSGPRGGIWSDGFTAGTTKNHVRPGSSAMHDSTGRSSYATY